MSVLCVLVLMSDSLCLCVGVAVVVTALSSEKSTPLLAQHWEFSCLITRLCQRGVVINQVTDF